MNPLLFSKLLFRQNELEPKKIAFMQLYKYDLTVYQKSIFLFAFEMWRKCNEFSKLKKFK